MKAVLASLVAIASLTLTATGAHAGAGGTPTPLSSFFVCQGINGGVAGDVVDIEIPLLGITLSSVKIGSASLACTFAKLFNPVTKAEIPPLNENVTGLDGDLKCYSMSTRRTASQGSPPTYNVEDVFGLDLQVRSSESRYLCAPARFLLNP
jgi:hypothetical protein